MVWNFRVIHFLSNFSILFALRQQVVFNGVFGSVKSSTGQTVKAGSEYKAAFLMAINDVNNKKDGMHDHLLPNTTILYSTGATDDSAFFTTISATYYAFSNTANGGYFTDVFIGPDGNNAFINAAGFASSLDISQISFQATTAQIVDSSFPQTSRMCHLDVMDAIAWGKVNVQQFNWKRMIAFTTSDTYGSTGLLLFNQFMSPEISLLGSFTFSSVHMDFTSIIQAAKKLDGYIFMMVASGTATARLLEQGYDLGLFREGTQIVGGQYLFSKDTLDAFTDKTKIPKIMKGVLAIKPAFNYSSTPQSRDFVTRWRAQPSQYTVRDGQPYCSNQNDSFGFPLYYAPVYALGMYYNRNVCTGIDFSKYRADGSDLDMNTGFAYDATIAAAKAMHHLIYVEKRDDFTYEDFKRVLISSVAFDGVTGRVSFNGGLDADKTGRGERLTGVAYKIWNFQPDYYASHPGSNGFVPVYSYSIEESFHACEGVCYPPVYNTADNSVPLDHAVEREVFMGPVRYFTLALAVFCSIQILRLMWFVFNSRKNRIVKTAQPMVLYMILFGAMFGCLKMWSGAIGTVSDSDCVFQQWSAHLAFGICVSSLISKAWTVNKIFNSGLKKVRIKPYDSVINVSLGVSVIVFFLCLITFVGKPKIIVEIRRPSLDDQPIKYVYCGAEDKSFNTILMVVEILILLVAVRVSLLIRDVPDGVNESSQILADVIIIGVIAIIEVIVRYFAGLNPLQIQASTDICFGVATIVCLLILFVPKVILVWKGYEFDHDMHLVKKGTIYSGSRNDSTKYDSQTDNNEILALEDAVARLRSFAPEESKRMGIHQIDLGKEVIGNMRKHVEDWIDLVNACTDIEAIEKVIADKGLENVYINPNVKSTKN